MGKIEIDYNILHDAFFRHQTKPRLTRHGDIYYEGMENTVQKPNIKAGRLSAELCEALGIAECSMPPWLPNMQRMGPPPTYPNLRIPGMNIQMPPIRIGEDGKPTGLFKDENGLTVYADVHGLRKDVYDKRKQPVKHWGELVDQEVPESDEEEELVSEDQDIDIDESIGDEDEDDDFLDPSMYPELAEDEPETFEQLKAGITSLIGEPAEQPTAVVVEKKAEPKPVEVMKVVEPKPAKKQKKDLDYEF